MFGSTERLDVARQKVVSASALFAFHAARVVDSQYYFRKAKGDHHKFTDTGHTPVLLKRDCFAKPLGPRELRDYVFHSELFQP